MGAMSERPLVLAPGETGPPFDTGPATRARRRGGRVVIVLLSVVVVALVGVAGWLGFAARTNEHRALAWQARAYLLKSDRSRLERVLVSRSKTLNKAIDQLN